MLKYIGYSGIGIFIGILGALFGLGGGFLIVPTLNLLGVEIHHAVGTSLAAIPFTSLSAVIVYFRQKRIHYKSGISLAFPSILGAYIGAWLTSYLSSNVLKVFFGMALFFVSIKMFRGKSIEVHQITLEELKPNYVLLSIWGFMVGILSGLLGFGGGAINVPFLVYLGFPIHYAVATSIFATFFTGMSGAIKHYALGNIEVQWLLVLVPGLIIGAQIGARTAKRIKAHNLKRAFAVVLAFLAIRMILKGLGFSIP